MGDEIERTLLTGYVIVANDVTAVQITDFTQPSGQFYEGLVACVSELAGCIQMADFDRNGILVPVIAGRGFFVQGNALDDLTLQSNDKVGTDIRRWICIVVPVLLRSGAGIAHIVDHNIPDTLQIYTTAGITVHFDNLLIDPVRDLSCCQLEYLFSGNDFVLVDMPPCCQKSQEQNESEKSFHALSDLLGTKLPIHDWNQNCCQNRVDDEQQRPCAYYGEAQIVHIKVLEVLHQIKQFIRQQC